MNVLRLFLVLVVLIVGLINRWHFKHLHNPPVVQSPISQKAAVEREPPQTRIAQNTAVNEELLQNAERLAETLRRCKETARNNQVTK
jgi:hypothetical protein